MYDEIGKHLGAGLETDLILLDFAKAVCLTKLLQKLSWFGVHGPLLAWFENYPSHRMQRVVVNGSFSNWNPLKSSVPQGSILGPILFLVYVHDLLNALSHCTLAMFADDSQLLKI